MVTENGVDLNKQREWSGKPGSLAIPEAYIRGLRYEVVVFSRKERGGTDFTFRCRVWEWSFATGVYVFRGVVIDTSKRNPKGEIELVRLTYHPEITLVGVGFMLIPAAEGDETSSDS